LRVSLNAVLNNEGNITDKRTLWSLFGSNSRQIDLLISLAPATVLAEKMKFEKIGRISERTA
jgi:hypothetical protein